jgi:peroxiredoxin Q/BCP
MSRSLCCAAGPCANQRRKNGPDSPAPCRRSHPYCTSPGHRSEARPCAKVNRPAPRSKEESRHGQTRGGSATAPAFTLPDQDGKPVKLSDFKGQQVIVYFYPADDTPGCTKEACQFNDNLKTFEKAGVAVLGISPDKAEKHVKFRTKYKLKFPLLTDADKKVMEKYGAWGEKTMYGKKTVGTIRSTFLVGPNGKIQRAWYHVRADGHAAKVLEEIAEGGLVHEAGLERCRASLATGATELGRGQARASGPRAVSSGSSSRRHRRAGGRGRRGRRRRRSDTEAVPLLTPAALDE